MHGRIITGLIIFMVSFSLQGFSQTTENSEHPLLDKYYPHADTNKTITNQIKPVYQVSLTSALPSPFVSFIYATCPAIVTNTPPFHGCRPVTNDKLSAKTLAVSKNPSPSLSVRIEIRERCGNCFVGGCETGCCCD